MTSDVTLNVRFPGELRELKKRGDAVLARAHISTSQAVRGLYRHLDETQQVPEWLAPEEGVYEKRRATMRALVGTAPLSANESVRTLKEERLSRLEF